MNNNKIEELQERLEELHRIQDARLACNADDLDIREEIAEVEDDINEENNNGNDTNVGSIGNSIEDIARIAKLITTKFNNDYSIDNKDKEAIEHILSDYKRVLKENEELTISNKEIDKECSRLEEKEVKLINENEHYKDLIYALETYYDITEEDLEECMKNDR